MISLRAHYAFNPKSGKNRFSTCYASGFAGVEANQALVVLAWFNSWVELGSTGWLFVG